MFEKYNLKENPFRIVPSLSKDIIWAGFPKTKKKFEIRIKKSLRIPNSSIVLNWGEYGSGKTHAARYFSKESVIKDISDSVERKMPLSLIINLPKGKNPVWDLYTQILDKLRFNEIHEKLIEVKGVDEAINNITDNEFIKKVLNAFYQAYEVGTVEHYSVDDFVNYLYEGTSKQRERVGLPRSVSTDNDCVDFLSAFFSLLTYEENETYSCVIIWIDEFEDIAMQNAASVTNINSFIRGLLDKAPSNLLMFINFTRSAFADMSDLSTYLQEAVKSRVKERIEFPLPTAEEFKEYLSDLLSAYRIENMDDKYFPFKEDMIDMLIKEQGAVSIRRFNEALSLLLETADIEGEDAIGIELYKANKSDLIGWKD